MQTSKSSPKKAARKGSFFAPPPPLYAPMGGRCPPSAEGKTTEIRRHSRPWLPLWGNVINLRISPNANEKSEVDFIQ